MFILQNGVKNMLKGTIVFVWAIFALFVWGDISIYCHLQDILILFGFVTIIICYLIVRFAVYKKERNA